MSVISVQATTAEYRLPNVDPRTGEEFASIADSSRRAFSEMRGLLAILRGCDEAPLAPQPTLADVRTLVDSTRSSGAHITCAIRPDDLDAAGSVRKTGPGADVEPEPGTVTGADLESRSPAVSPAAARTPGRPRLPAARRPGCRAGSGRDP